MPRPKRQPERSSAEAILEAAEALIGRHGLEGVSLRQIGAAAGSGNNYAVQYHFGDADGLVRAILARRMAEVDRLQQALLERLETEDRLSDVRGLVDVFLRPLLQPVDAEGEPVYARFIVALLNSPEGARHFRELFHLSPTAARIQARLHAAVPHLPAPLLAERLRLVAIMVLAGAFNRVVRVSGARADAAFRDDALDVAAAGLLAPVRPALDVALKAQGGRVAGGS